MVKIAEFWKYFDKKPIIESDDRSVFDTVKLSNLMRTKSTSNRIES